MTSRTPRLPEIPLLPSSKASTPRGSATKGATPRKPNGTPRSLANNVLAAQSVIGGGGVGGFSGVSSTVIGGRAIATDASGTPIVLSSTSKTRYVLATPAPALPPVSPRTAAQQQQNTTTSTALTVVEHALTASPPQDTDEDEQKGGQLQTHIPQSLTNAAAASTKLTTTGNGVGMLSTNELRNIKNLVTFNSKLKHGHRSHNAASVIPSLSFAVRLRGPCDDLIGLRVAPIDPQESALDVVLRLTSPEELRVPAVSDPKTSMPLSSRLVGLLKGSTSIPVHWQGEKEGVEKDHAHIQALRDAKMRVEAATRQDNSFNEAKGRCCLAALHYNSQNLEGVIKVLNPAAALFEDCEHAAGLAFVHNLLGVSYYHNGEYKMALVHFRKQEALCSSYGKAVARINMGVCYGALDEPQFSLQAFSDAVVSAVESKEPVLKTIAVGNKGIAFMRLGQLKAAQGELEACLEHCSIAGDHIGTVVVLLLLGQNSAACKDYAQAIFYYEHAMRVAEQANCAPLLAMAKVSVGVCKGQAESKGQLMEKATAMGKPLSVADVVNTLAIKE